MDDPLIGEVLDRLDADSRISGSEADLVLGALLHRLDEVIDGTVPERPVVRGEDGLPPVLAYLESIRITGFRGIGPTCELQLSAGPGLTLVVGRNGSGKSSLAEAAELALTGDTLRWSGKTKDWKSGWRNLHASSDPAIEIMLRVDREREPRTVRVAWSTGDLDSHETTVTIPGDGRHSLESLGWDTAVRTFRPFLSYTELSKMIEGRPVDRYNALAPMLGMETLQRPIEALRQARLSSEKQAATAQSEVGEVLTLLGECPDDRARVANEALRDTWDLVTVERLVAGTEPTTAERDQLIAALTQLPPPQSELIVSAARDLREAINGFERLRGTDADRAERVAELLEAAVHLHDQHGDVDCPVCGRADGLSGERVAEMHAEIGRLRTEARAVIAARTTLDRARTAALDAVGSPPQVLGRTTGESLGLDLARLKNAWASWIETPDSNVSLTDHLESNVDEVISATEEVRVAALRRQQELEDSWRPVATRLAELLPVARAGQLAQRQIAPLKKAERWLKTCEATIRDQRFETIRDQVKAVWTALAVDSNVNLEDVRLGTKKVEMDVTVDGDDSAALGVMSQGELHALALSLFIPRVQFDDSPFAFALLDDPVQAMDPVRVDGLARVLADLAEKRQVVVFTHDDRLPSAIRRLQISASILRVDRRPRSEVEIRVALDPVSAAIDDARALQLSGSLPPNVARRVVPGLCRQAVEAACLESGRRRLLASGLGHQDVEEALGSAVKLLPLLAVALYSDIDRAGDVYGTLNNKYGSWAADTVRDCNELTHAGADEYVDLRDLVDRTERLSKKLMAL